MRLQADKSLPEKNRICSSHRPLQQLESRQEAAPFAWMSLNRRFQGIWGENQG
ncbi:MAG TPA: hypothetical protein VHS96_00510 [Bacteroidia bacterium]|nr:hypothetical protein [Bacteroidia bacterium]